MNIMTAFPDDGFQENVSHDEKGSRDGGIHRFIHPGEFFFCGSGSQIHTILGSCIAITLWHPILRVGGMCHFILPGKSTSQGGHQAGSEPKGRYSDDAMVLFEAEATSRGTDLREYQAKIFGGSNMLVNSQQNYDDLIGTKNIKAAMALLAERDIPLLASHVGKAGHQRIIFVLETGDVWVKHQSLGKITI